MSSSEPADAAVVVRLLDPNQGRPLQEWRFVSRSDISIGRSDERDIVIPDPQVSRQHVLLSLRDGNWWLISQGRNGVFVEGLMVTEQRLGTEMSFRLGLSGPLLSFFDSSVKSAASSSATVQSLETDEFADLRIDRSKLDDDVREIADGDFFKQLASRAGEFRRPKGQA